MFLEKYIPLTGPTMQCGRPAHVTLVIPHMGRQKRWPYELLYSKLTTLFQFYGFGILLVPSGQRIIMCLCLYGFLFLLKT